MELIRGMSSPRPSPVLIILKSLQCAHCRVLEQRWGEISAQLRAVDPTLRFFSIMYNNEIAGFDYNIAPRDCMRYAGWFPSLILVPGRIWDQAMLHLGADSTSQVRDGVQIFNGVEVNGVVQRTREYSIARTEDIVAWLRRALSNEHFRRASDGEVRPAETRPRTLIAPDPTLEESRTSDVCSLKLISKYYPSRRLV